MRDECADKECSDTAVARGLCNTHYQRACRGGRLPDRSFKRTVLAPPPAKPETWLKACEAAELRINGYTLRDIGEYLDLSHSRVGQLVPYGAARLAIYAKGLLT
jgi:hypothetical protein